MEVVGGLTFFVPGTGIGVSRDTESIVHVGICYRCGTGKYGHVTASIQRRGSDAVGVKGVQVKRSATAL